MGYRAWLSAAAGVCAVGCATQLAAPEVSDEAIRLELQKQLDLVIATSWKRQTRLMDVADPVRIAGADLCGDEVAPVGGIAFGRVDDFPSEYRRAARKTFGSSTQVKVWHVVRGLPAYQAGLQVGDLITAVNGAPVALTEDAVRLLRNAGATIRVDILRSGRPYAATLRPAMGCRYPVELTQGADVNAFADGGRVMINQGMMRFVESDAELALVIGHEIAHNSLGHLDRKATNEVAGMVLGGLLDVAAAAAGVNSGGAGMRAGGGAGAHAFSQAFEKEADYMGVYLAARARHDVSDAANFWRRMAIEYPGSVKQNYLASHPSTPERSLGIERAAREIAGKRARGAALLPRRKDSRSPVDR